MLLTDAQRLRIYASEENIAKAEAYIDKLVAEAPPLAEDQKVRLRMLLRPAPHATATLQRLAA